jgi:4a-hydroxytetrahydrobiopterin dehydratase
MELRQERCGAGSPRLTEAEVVPLAAQVPEWQHDGHTLTRTFRFPRWLPGVAFANAVAWIAHEQDHHPTLSLHYDHVVVSFSTHDVGGGLTRNDFIAAAKVDVAFGAG